MKGKDNMKATVLIDNKSDGCLISEWGLAIYIEHNGKKILLDSGSTGDFIINAAVLKTDLQNAEICVLSHAHYDHADGLDSFMSVNEKATLYIREGTRENCYNRHEGRYKYDGIRRGTLKKYADRIEYVSGNAEISKGVFLIPHSTDDLSMTGLKAELYRRKGLRFFPDDFAHEQSLVIETGKGLCIFSSCSHAGADNIIKEVTAAFPGKHIALFMGGMHLFRSSEKEVRAFAKRVKETGIEHLCTGHCTGDEAFAILREELGDRVVQFYSGYTLEV